MAQGNTVPTPITDKNGKQTTVHKKTAPGAATSRLSGVGAPKAAEFKNLRVPPEYKIELKKSEKVDGETIIVNGVAIGSVSRRTVIKRTSNSRTSGTRNVVEWRASVRDAESDIKGTEKSLTRPGAPRKEAEVENYVLSYIRNQEVEGIREEFFARGGTEFKNSVLEGVTYKGNRIATGASYRLSTSFGGGGDRLPQNRFQVFTSAGQYEVLLDGEDSVVIFMDAGRPVFVPIDEENGVIDEENLPSTIAQDQEDVLSNARRTIKQMFHPREQ